MSNAISKFRGDYSFLSNIYESKVVYDDKIFSSAENAFQYAKLPPDDPNPELTNLFLTLDPIKAKQLGKEVRLRDDWEDVKLDIMYQILKSKFSNPILAGKLISTGDRELIEGNYWKNTYWGVSNGVGENHLGKLLMRIRDELAHHDYPVVKIDYDNLDIRTNSYRVNFEETKFSPLMSQLRVSGTVRISEVDNGEILVMEFEYCPNKHDSLKFSNIKQLFQFDKKITQNDIKAICLAIKDKVVKKLKELFETKIIPDIRSELDKYIRKK